MPEALAQQKFDLLRTLEATDRGRHVLPDQKSEILAKIAALEARNPTPYPTAAPTLLEGNWLTLFTTSADLLRLANSLPLVTTGEIYQCIRTQTQQVFNVAEVQGSGWLGAWVPRGVFAVSARFKPASEQRVQVVFERFVLGSQALMNYEIESFLYLLEHAPGRIPALKIDIRRREQSGWLDITYLDEDLRIGRGSEGSLFVLQKVSS
ncbi:PAP/fibrillin family protein [Thermostichus vulcanus]|uniref:PAP/fibrillin family protein n=1 Tax=Thermostichus vulcanus str. 'Rupite' TaxID=2813851 RepID=A0ABT0CF07_THEVL|nr:PAP/fibrillin family protein [Thermostichus vulcanus]MCJ2544369.1 PAP/fibrillin family protein [Thermostichus vulcanus str. 'Rupite']